jgi:hypothetical protein
MSFFTQLGHLLRRKALPPTEGNAPRFSLADTVHLPFSADFGLELANGPQHVEQQAARGIAGVDALIEHLEIDFLPLEFLGNLAKVQSGARHASRSSRVMISTSPSRMYFRHALKRGRISEVQLCFS